MVNYETGIASTPTDLLSKLATFLLAHGWDTHTPASGDIVIANDTSGSVWAGIDATTTEWKRRGCTGFNGAAAYDAQPGHSGVTDTVTWGAGPYTAYHFFVGDEDGNEYCHVSVEISASVYRHFVLGELVKYGTYTGGVYHDFAQPGLSDPFNMNNGDWGGHHAICDANSGVVTAMIWVDYDARPSPNWQPVLASGNQATANVCLGGTRSTSMFAAFHALADQAWNLRTPLLPANYFVTRAGSLLSPIGRIPNYRLVNMRNIVPGEIITYGSDEWMIFPYWNRFSTPQPTGQVSSALYGLAHRR